MTPVFPTGGPGGPAPAEETVLLKIFSMRGHADLAVSSLEARGIPCWVTTDDAGGMLPNLTAPGGVKLFVRKADAEAASSLLNAPGAPPEPDAAFAPDTASTGPAANNVPVIVFAGLVVGVLVFLFYAFATGGRTEPQAYQRGELSIYSRDGYLSAYFKDRNGDGKWDYWADYDEHGHRISARADNNFDGKPDEFLTYSNSELVSIQWDTDFNGIPDVTYTYKYGVIQQGDWRPNGSATITRRELYANGVLHETLRDTGGRGFFDEQVLYDAFENPVKTNTVTLPVNP